MFYIDTLPPSYYCFYELVLLANECSKSFATNTTTKILFLYGLTFVAELHPDFAIQFTLLILRSSWVSRAQ